MSFWHSTDKNPHAFNAAPGGERCNAVGPHGRLSGAVGKRRRVFQRKTTDPLKVEKPRLKGAGNQNCEKFAQIFLNWMWRKKTCPPGGKKNFGNRSYPSNERGTVKVQREGFPHRSVRTSLQKEKRGSRSHLKGVPNDKREGCQNQIHQVTLLKGGKDEKAIKGGASQVRPAWEKL